MTFVTTAFSNGHRRRRSWRRILSLLFAVTGSTLLNAQPLPPLSDVQQLAAGEGHACVLTTSGAVKCWGNNEYGQLGDGTTTHRYLPANVIGLSSGVIAISAGYRHSCALMAAGSVKCWGKNLLQQLGDGTSTNRLTPVNVLNLTDATAITAGGDHTCALIGLTGLKCWGFNYYGELGIGNTTNQSTPANVIGGQNLLAVSAGYSHTCALTTTNTVKCWGVRDRVCNLVTCSYEVDVSPTAVSALGSDVMAISAGQYFSCARTSGGAVKCWGDNYYNQLGDLGNDNPNPVTPFPISGLNSGVASISAGYRHACARLADGTARCWGDNTAAQLGDGSNVRALTPVTVSGLTTAATIAAGGSFSCAQMASNGVKCWGSNSAGQLGDNEPWFRSRPVDVVGLGSGVQSIASGEFHSCAVTASGAVKCWGNNNSGQIGDGSTLQRGTPVAVTGISSGAATVSTGANHSCSVSTSGAVKCWGANDLGQVGDGSHNQRLTPVPVVGLNSGIIKVDAGNFHSCARTTTGAPKCWGSNSDGQIGNGSVSLSFTSPVSVNNLASGIRDISGGEFHSCAIVSAGGVACWGRNDSAQLGDGSYNDSNVPVTLSFLDPVSVSISAGSTHSCVVGDREIFCWGTNNNGECGTGFPSSPIVNPVLLPDLRGNALAVSAGFRYACAIADGGQAFCWGNNGFGQLGDGSTSNRSRAVAVNGLDSGVSQISAGSYHSCALAQGGNVKCWGYNINGQLGIGIRNYRLPADVLDNPAFFYDGFEAPGP